MFPIRQNAPLPDTSAEKVGNKAWNLIRMAAAGLPVPPGFVLPAAWCRERRRTSNDSSQDTALTETLAAGIDSLESATGLGFGSAQRPLLVSVRSGSATSMPGMMQTVLNVGLNADTVEGLIRLTGNPRLAWDCYRRFIQSYAEVVHGLPRDRFDELVRSAIAAVHGGSTRDLDFRASRQLTEQMLERFRELAGSPFPYDPKLQLFGAADAVFRSWDSPTAISYRKLKKIDENAGTAATIQRMVFGNAGGASGSGVAFTRDPATGEHHLYVDFVFDGQGEDVVAGRHVLQDSGRLARSLPQIWKQLAGIANTLEELLRDAQDFEFTVENGSLFLLQTRSANRTAWAALRIAVDLVEQRLIDSREALSRIASIDTAAVTRTRIRAVTAKPVGRAQVASIGIATGAIALDAATARKMAQAGRPSILVRQETATEDIEGIASAAGILTGSGGRTSHAAVVARQLGKVCLVACRDLRIDLPQRICSLGDHVFREGDLLSLDGDAGAIYAGAVEVTTERPQRELAAIAAWQRRFNVATPGAYRVNGARRRAAL